MREPVVRVEQRERVGYLTLDRPAKLNALTYEMFDQLGAGIEQLQSAAGVHCIVLAGNGRAFSAGFDLNEPRPSTVAQLRQQLSAGIDALRAILTAPVPTIAAVRGACLGAAFDLALCCDLVLASSDAFFGYTESAFGMGASTFLLPFSVGRHRSAAALLTGERISAEQAERWGFVNAVGVDEDVADTVARYADRLSRIPIGGLRSNRVHLRRVFELMALERVVDVGEDLHVIRSATRGDEPSNFDRLVEQHGLKEALRVFGASTD